MSQRYASKQAIARRWINKRKATETSKRSWVVAPARGIRSFTSTGPRVGAPLSAVLKAKFRVNGSTQLNPGAGGAIATVSLLANSLNDPFGSISVFQPRGYDQLAGTLYAKYRVRKATVNIQFCQVSTTATAMAGAAVVGFQFTDSASAPSAARDAIEQGYCVWKGLSNDQSANANLTMVVDMAKFKGRPVTDDEMSANYNADPADICYCHVFMQALDGTLDLNPMFALITIDFEADLFDPINVAAS